MVSLTTEQHMPIACLGRIKSNVIFIELFHQAHKNSLNPTATTSYVHYSLLPESFGGSLIFSIGDSSSGFVCNCVRNVSLATQLVASEKNTRSLMTKYFFDVSSMNFSNCSYLGFNSLVHWNVKWMLEWISRRRQWKKRSSQQS